jgi:hypothetical protein
MNLSSSDEIDDDEKSSVVTNNDSQSIENVVQYIFDNDPDETLTEFNKNTEASQYNTILKKKRPAEPSNDKPPAIATTVNDQSIDKQGDSLSPAVQQVNDNISQFETDLVTTEPAKKKQRTTTPQQNRKQQKTNKTAQTITSQVTHDSSKKMIWNF